MSRQPIAVRIRPLRPEDIPAWVALINAADAVDELGRATTVEEARAKLRSPGYGYDRVLLAWHRRRLLGYADLWRQADDRAIGGVTVHPFFRGRGVGRKLLRRLIGLARREGVRVLDVPVVPRIQAAVALLIGAGFRRVRYWWEMVWVGRVPPPAPDPPPGVRLRTYHPGQDAQAWLALDAAAFSRHWGATPLTPEDVAALADRPDFDPDGLWFAEVDGKLVGQALARYNKQGPTLLGMPVGRIDEVAVLPAYRGRGIGRALVLAAMNYLWSRGCRVIELTVDGENARARRLYDTLGFVEAGQLHWYRYELESGRSSD
ncbi:MAG: GNAT family N-acetyltransferase [Chloroflexi bacterium]|nr:GNAT family N-acetyltransferase [Chloroflexota bacterium]